MISRACGNPVSCLGEPYRFVEPLVKQTDIVHVSFRNK